ncbi:hypothetical protein [Microcella sp.]|uniref:hypothetical protein n=1 Tax=Microcella sp. TaxID=1913979 RepID=UPI00255F26B3|nr:hypothetical protein [Microcella sp.]MBX9473094.1 hypothetical protein [Microcella sp.]
MGTVGVAVGDEEELVVDGDASAEGVDAEGAGDEGSADGEDAHAARTMQKTTAATALRARLDIAS